MSGVRFSSKTFQSTLLMRGATRASLHLFQRIPISIHAPHARSDDIRIIDADFIDDFNPRSSCEERPDHCKSITVTIIFQSTLLMRGATFSSAASSTFPGVFQSTLLMRGATNSSSVSELAKTISIHAPHARSDERQAVIDPHVDEFQSTLLMRGATMRLTWSRKKRSYFNPRSSCEERQPLRASSACFRGYFNPRSSCEERLVSLASRCSRY